MSKQEYQEMTDRIIYGLQVAEREMLEEKVRRGGNVIVGNESGGIRSVPASNYL